jgi:hypothetical protein
MNIFETKAEMPDENNSDVVRTAQTMPQRNRNYLPAAMPQERSVENIQPRRRGHNY